jgi:DNA-binding transcriptional ArsR family regulator
MAESVPAYARGLRDHRLNGQPDIATVAALIGDDARAAMLLALLRGEPISASRLAAEARVGLPAASKHLAKLVGGGLLRVQRRGRMREYQLAGNGVAAAIEALASLAPLRSPRTLSESSRLEALRTGRTCYDHLAGRLGVALFQGLVAHGALGDLDMQAHAVRKVRNGLGAVELGPAAESVFAGLGVWVERKPRAAAACLDWTEERPHLSGWLGAELCASLLEKGWVLPTPSSRAVRATPAGRASLRELLGLELENAGTSSAAPPLPGVARPR